MANRVRTNVYIEDALKEEAKAFLKQYGISLSNGINLLLQQMIQNKKIPLPDNIELLTPNDKDYKLIEETKDEDTVSLKEFMNL